jgi:hypothetical protein
MGMISGADRGARAAPAGRVRGARASFVLRRLGSARLLAASLLFAVLTSVAVTTALAGFGAEALPAAAHRRLASEPGTPILISGQIGAATARADTPVIRSSLRSALGAVPFTLVSGRWSDQLALPGPHRRGTIPLIQAAVLGGVTAHTELTAGNWPGPPRRGRPIGVALPVTTARMLGLAAGDTLDLRDSTTGAPARLRVTGLFRVRDPGASYWRLSLLGTSGAVVQGAFITYGPMLVNPAALGPGGLTTGGASWLARVDTARIPPARIAALQRRLTGAVASLEGAQRLGGLQVTTRLPQTLSALASSLVVSRSLLLIGSLELILLALAAVTLAARLLAAQREEETALLTARGVARRQLALASLAEAALLAVTGAAAGAVLGSYAATALLSANGLPADGAASGPAAILRPGAGGGVWWLAAVIVVLAIIVMSWPALRPAAPGEARARRGRQAALAGAARAGLDVALVTLGVLAFWELRRYSAVPRLPGGGLGIDPVLAAAPAVALAGLALIPLRILPAAARLLDRRSARGRRLVAALASWQVSRRPQRQGGPILLVVLAVATGTLALAQHQSWQQSQLDRAAFATGADVRVDLAAPLAPGRAGALAHAPGVLGAMPVAAFNSGFEVFALDARAAAGTVLLRPDLSPLPPVALWRAITPTGAGGHLALPVPAIATSAFFSSARAHVGEVVPLPVGNVSVPVRLVAKARAFPTAGAQPAVIVDLAWLQDALTRQSQPALPVTQWWLRTERGVPAGLPPGAAVTSRAALAAGLLNDPLPNVPQLGLLVIVMAAALLACIGFTVSVVAAVRERRLTDALLAAFGVGPGRRAGQLSLEQLMLSLPAAAAGALIGTVLARWLVPAVTLTGGAAAPFPPARVVVPLVPLALLALAVAAVPVLAAAATAAYRPDPAARLRAGESA